MQFVDYLVIGAEFFLMAVVIIGFIFEKHVIRIENAIFAELKRRFVRFKRLIRDFITKKLRKSERFMSWLYDEKPSISEQLEADYLIRVRVVKGWQNVPDDYQHRGLQNTR